MSTTERRNARGLRRAERAIASLADEFHEKRLATGLSQLRVAQGAGISRASYQRVERGRMGNLSIADASQIAAVLGLELSVKVFPGGNSLRDEAQIRRLELVLSCVREPLTYRTEVPLPQDANRPFEQRAWDAIVFGFGRRTGFEVEMRIRDAQALERRVELKRRDDPVDSLVVLVADTSRNRQVIRDHPTLLLGLARLTSGSLTKMLKAGQHPPDALVFV